MTPRQIIHHAWQTELRSVVACVLGACIVTTFALVAFTGV